MNHVSEKNIEDLCSFREHMTETVNMADRPFVTQEKRQTDASD